MLSAAECRELAKSFRQLAYGAGVPRKERLLLNIARSLSGLASQLEALAREGPLPQGEDPREKRERRLRSL